MGQPEEFRSANVDLVLTDLLEVVNRRKGEVTMTELVFAAASLLKSLGLSIYDGPNPEYNALLKEYKTSPSWGGGLILFAENIGSLFRMFLEEASDPERNKEEWMKGEKVSEVLSDD